MSLFFKDSCCSIFLGLQGALSILLYSPYTAGSVIPFDCHGCPTSTQDVVNLEEAQFGADLDMQTSCKIHHHCIDVERDFECHCLLKLGVFFH